MLTHDQDLRLNRLAQALDDLEGGLQWFEAQNETAQDELLLGLAAMIKQAGARTADVLSAVQEAKLRPTCTPAVLLSKAPLDAQIAKAIQLPTNERHNTFLLLLMLLRVADSRRKADRCGGKCSHWWHNL